MSVVAVASVRSCGVTTLTAGLAMVWPSQRHRLVIEADPAGGMLAAAAGLPPEPGLVSLAAAARRHDDPAVALEHCQPLPGGTAVLCGPPTAERARSALTMLSGLLGRLDELDADVFVDCGRLEPAASNAIFFEQADLGVLAVRPRLADLHALGAFLHGRHRPAAVFDARAHRFGSLPARRGGRRARSERRRANPLGSRCCAGAGDHVRLTLASSPGRRWCGPCARSPMTWPAGSDLGPEAVATSGRRGGGERSWAGIDRGDAQ